MNPSLPQTQRRIVLAQKPDDKLTPEHFRLETAELPALSPDSVLLRLRYLSIDAANRAWMQSATYRGQLATGLTMAGHGLGEVLASTSPLFQPGDLVTGDLGWQDHAVLPAAGLRRAAHSDPLSHQLSVYGISGLTAYLGLSRVGRVQAGETVAVSAAAGSVGVLAAQIAQRMGARVIGIAGGADKCEWLLGEIGLDAIVDYKAGNLGKQLRQAAPDGVDVYFDNVGGDILGACLFGMNIGGRIVCCGAVSQYDGPTPPHGPRGIPGLLVTKRLIMQGFLVHDHFDARDEALDALRSWVEAGSLKVPEDILEGLEQAPRALIGLLAGDNRGKRMVRIA